MITTFVGRCSFQSRQTGASKTLSRCPL
jgi:hypothetical protein